MNYPKISIVTPSFNQGKFLEQTIVSVIGQKYPNLEYLIIDGGSADNSVEIIKKYEKHLAYWVSEKDKGQSDAINKGLSRVTGDLFNWINSDDLLEEGALLKVAEAYSRNPDKKIYSFGLYYLDGSNKNLFKLQNDSQNKLQCFCDPVIAQPAAFLSAEGVKKAGGVNPMLHYSMDYELWLKFMFTHGESCLHVSNDPIASFRVHPDAKTAEGNMNFQNDIATMLYSLSAKAGLKKYHELLNEIYAINKKYEFVCPVASVETKLVERMVIYFLLKWKRNIYNKRDFLSVKKILKEIDFSKIDLSEKEKEWYSSMKENALPSSWLQFRAKRKVKHILPG